MYGAVSRLHVCFLMWSLIKERQPYFLFLPLLLANVNIDFGFLQFFCDSRAQVKSKIQEAPRTDTTGLQ